MTSTDAALTAISGSLVLLNAAFIAVALVQRQRDHAMAPMPAGHRGFVTPRPTVAASKQSRFGLLTRGTTDLVPHSSPSRSDHSPSTEVAISPIKGIARRLSPVPTGQRDTEAKDVTIMFSDIQDSTSLNEQIGDHAWVALLERHDQILIRAVDKHGGHVVKSQGDGMMMAFDSPDDAVAAALDIQDGIVASRSSLLDMVVRLGVHTGQVVQRDGDLFGRDVAYAARVAATAQGGEVRISERTLHAMTASTESAQAAVAVTSTTSTELRGLRGRHAVHTVTRPQTGAPHEAHSEQGQSTRTQRGRLIDLMM